MVVGGKLVKRNWDWDLDLDSKEESCVVGSLESNSIHTETV